MTAVGRWKTAGKKKRRKNKAKWDDYFNKEIYILEKKKVYCLNERSVKEKKKTT